MHPYLWEGRAINWDEALGAATSKIGNAESDDAETAAVGAMLALLHDPITRVEATTDPAVLANAPRAQTSATWPSSTVLVIKLAPHDWGDIERNAADLRRDIVKAKAVVVDLREADDRDSWRAAMVVDSIGNALVAHDCVAPAMRGLLHSGYRPQRGTTSGGYFTAFVSAAATAFTAPKGAHPERVVFLVNEHSVLPDVALAMQRSGDAAVVAEGRMPDPSSARRRSIPLVAGKAALYRTTELESVLAPDVALPASQDIEGGPALTRSVELAKRGWTSHRDVTTVAPLPAARWTPDATYPEEAYPKPEHRLLALFRLWNVIRLFYPYQHLMDPGAWDRALTDFIPRFEQAKDAREYALAIAALAARIPDSHVRLRSPEFWEFLGWPVNYVTIQRIEHQPVITLLGETEKAAGLRIGDVLVSIDGEPFESRATRVRPFIASSNAWTLARDADTFATGGAKDSEAVLRVRGDGGGEREVRLKRSAWSPRPTASPPYKLLESGAVGYVDLGSLTVGDVDPMFAALGHSRAIVFDIRSGTRGTMWQISEHLNVRGPVPDAQHFRMLVGFTGSASETEARYSFFTRLFDDPRPKYTGKTVLLVNEYTQSQAESTAMMFQAACDAKIVGSTTAGADGDITSTCLPGGICVFFTGHDVRFADGRQLQRVGMKPDFEARPTIAGLRADRDEVLERALRYLREGH